MATKECIKAVSYKRFIIHLFTYTCPADYDRPSLSLVQQQKEKLRRWTRRQQLLFTVSSGSEQVESLCTSKTCINKPLVCIAHKDITLKLRCLYRFIAHETRHMRCSACAGNKMDRNVNTISFWCYTLVYSHSHIGCGWRTNAHCRRRKS